MTERKDTNPFNTEGSTPPHLPASVYQPNPFPINPAEGNPWAGTTNEQPYQKPPQQGHVNAYDNTSSSYGHSYNTSDQSNYSTYTMQMPTPSVNYNINNSSPYGYSNSAYNQNAYAPTYDTNAYSTNAYNPNPNEYSNTNVNHGVDASEHDGHVKSEREDSYDENTTELDGSVTAANPGIETHDPDKLNISNGTIKASLNGTPNKWRLLSRFIQFIASVGALAFIIGAPVASHVSTPSTANNTAIIFLHIVSIVSIIYSFSHLVFYCLRRWRHKNKAPRWSLLLVDIVLGVSFGTLMVFLIKDFRCPPGKLNGWCDFYNTAIFFTVLAFLTYAVSFIWDLVGGFKSIRS